MEPSTVQPLYSAARSYRAVSFNPNSWIVRDGVKIYDSIADCVHGHKTVEAAARCLSRLLAKGSTAWYNGEIRDDRDRAVER